MKLLAYLLLPALTVASLSSCSDDDDNKGPAQTEANAIQFNAIVPRPSRAVTTTLTIRNFSIWAFANNSLFMNNIRVTRGEDTTPSTAQWNYSPTMYWPADNAPVNFYGISPAVPTDMGFEGSNSGYITNYRDDDGETDLLYTVTAGATRTSNNAPVNLNFRHALSLVNFNLRSADASLTVKVKEADLMNVYTQATFQYPSETTTANMTDANQGKWMNHGLIDSPDLFDTDTYISLGEDYTFINGDEYMFAIPQELQMAGANYQGAYVRVLCQIEQGQGVKVWPSATSEGYDAGTGYGYIYFPLRTATTVANAQQWIAGHQYNYNITVGVPEDNQNIQFTVTVDEYKSFTPEL